MSHFLDFLRQWDTDVAYRISKCSVQYEYSITVWYYEVRTNLE